MFAGYGPITQLGYVVSDIAKAMQDWSSRLRIGPWFYRERLPLDHYRFRGVDHVPARFHMSYALANSGDMQIELIQQRCDTPSVYLEFLERHGEGLQHLCVWPSDYDGTVAKACASGLELIQEGRFGPIRFCYFGDAGHAGTCLEVSEMVEMRRPLIEAIRDAAAIWDGSDPVRNYPA